MSAITNINNTISSAVLLPTRGRLQQVQNTERQIAHIDREIEAAENLITKNRQLSSTTQEMIVVTQEMMVVNRELYNNNLKKIVSNNEVISITKELIALHKEQRQTLIESRDLDRKRIALLEEIVEVHKNTIKKHENLLENTNGRLQALLDRGGRSKSAEPVLNTKTSELNKLDEKHIVLTKKDAVLKEQSKVKDILLEKQNMKIEHLEKQATNLEDKTKGVVTNSSVQAKVKSEDINLSKVNTSTTNSKKDVSQTPVTYKPAVVPQVKTYSNDELVPNTKTGLTVNALYQQVRASQRNIYDSITNNLISSKFSKLL